MLIGRRFDQRNVAVLLASLLGSLVLLSASSGAPLVGISEIPDLESGAKVKLVGILVEARVYDFGAEGLILADLLNHAIVRIISSAGIRPQPSSYASIGDELLVLGEVADSESEPLVFTKSDDVKVFRESEISLTIETLANNWFLFENDLIKIKGLLDRDGLGSAVRLYDSGMNSSIVVQTGTFDIGSMLGHEVLLTGTLIFDQRTFALVLVLLYAVPAA